MSDSPNAPCLSHCPPSPCPWRERRLATMWLFLLHVKVPLAYQILPEPPSRPVLCPVMPRALLRKPGTMPSGSSLQVWTALVDFINRPPHNLPLQVSHSTCYHSSVQSWGSTLSSGVRHPETYTLVTAIVLPHAAVLCLNALGLVGGLTPLSRLAAMPFLGVQGAIMPSGRYCIIQSCVKGWSILATRDEGLICRS